MIGSQRKISGEGFRYDADGQMACYIIHGFTGSTYEMNELGKYMASQGITAVADTLPGHGTSPEDCNTKVYQDWIDSVQKGFDRLSAEKEEVFVVGFSLGGALTLKLAMERDIPGIVLYAPIIKHKKWYANGTRVSLNNNDVFSDWDQGTGSTTQLLILKLNRANPTRKNSLCLI